MLSHPTGTVPGSWGKALLDMHKDHRREKTIAFVKGKMMEIIEARTALTILAGTGEILGRLGDDRDLKVFVKVKGGSMILKIWAK